MVLVVLQAGTADLDSRTANLFSQLRAAIDGDSAIRNNGGSQRHMLPSRAQYIDMMKETLSELSKFGGDYSADNLLALENAGAAIEVYEKDIVRFMQSQNRDY